MEVNFSPKWMIERPCHGVEGQVYETMIHSLQLQTG